MGASDLNRMLELVSDMDVDVDMYLSGEQGLLDLRAQLLKMCGST